MTNQTMVLLRTNMDGSSSSFFFNSSLRNSVHQIQHPQYKNHKQQQNTKGLQTTKTRNDSITFIVKREKISRPHLKLLQLQSSTKKIKLPQNGDVIGCHCFFKKGE